MTFRNDRIPSRNGCGKITTGRAVESKRKIIRSKHDHRADLRQATADVVLGVDCRLRPTPLTSRCGGLSQLIRGAREFGSLQSWFNRQTGLLIRHRDEFRSASLNAVSKPFEKLRRSRMEEFGPH